jgi:hypothetical protein
MEIDRLRVEPFKLYIDHVHVLQSPLWLNTLNLHNMVKRKELGDVTMGGTKPEESDSDEVRCASRTVCRPIANHNGSPSSLRLTILCKLSVFCLRLGEMEVQKLTLAPRSATFELFFVIGCYRGHRSVVAAVQAYRWYKQISHCTLRQHVNETHTSKSILPSLFTTSKCICQQGTTKIRTLKVPVAL